MLYSVTGIEGLKTSFLSLRMCGGGKEIEREKMPKGKGEGERKRKIREREMEKNFLINTLREIMIQIVWECQSSDISDILQKTIARKFTCPHRHCG